MLFPNPTASHSWQALTGMGDALWKRNTANNITTTELASQWVNPTDVSTLLMIIGGDVVQNALAQSTGSWFTPVCFSFGWVSYAFIALLHVVGDGRLLPPPDYPVKVINLKSGYARENRNWVIGRILRDAEGWIERKQPLDDDGIRITIFEAQRRHAVFQEKLSQPQEKDPESLSEEKEIAAQRQYDNANRTKFRFDRSHLFGLGVMIIQLTVASIPVILHREWGVVFITATGTFLVQIAGALPQWRAEKLPNRQHSDAIYALTTGNGSKDIVVIIGNGQCLDLEEFCVSDTPRNGKPWEKFRKFSKPRKNLLDEPGMARTDSELWRSRDALGLPYGFWVTRIISVILSIAWLLLLINVAAIKSDTWYIVLVGSIGMFQNGILAAMEKSPGSRNLPLRYAETIRTKKVMDALMDFEFTYKCGRPLVREFFPGDLRPEERDWWEGNPDAYDIERERNQKRRGVPRRFLPHIITVSTPKVLETRSQEHSPMETPETVKTPVEFYPENRHNEPHPDPESWREGNQKGLVSFAERPTMVENENFRPMPPSPPLLHPSSRVASPHRSSLRSRRVLSLDATNEDVPTSSTMTMNISVDDVRKAARSPDWAS